MLLRRFWWTPIAHAFLRKKNGTFQIYPHFLCCYQVLWFCYHPFLLDMDFSLYRQFLWTESADLEYSSWYAGWSESLFSTRQVFLEINIGRSRKWSTGENSCLFIWARASIKVLIRSHLTLFRLAFPESSLTNSIDLVRTEYDESRCCRLQHLLSFYSVRM